MTAVEIYVKTVALALAFHMKNVPGLRPGAFVGFILVRYIVAILPNQLNSLHLNLPF